MLSIKKIKEIIPIEGADRIELAKLDGWQCVVEKNKFKVNEEVVYVGIDTIIPNEEKFGSLKGIVVKTKRLKGQLSQGLLFSLNDLYNLLELKKYEKPVPEGEGIKGNFPEFILKTDEPRLQNHLNILEEHPFEDLYATIKEDGTSFTCYKKGDYFGICSRSYELERNTSNLYWKMAIYYDLENKLRKFNYDIALQGELVGEKCSGNKMGYKGNKIKFFNAYNITEQRYLDYSELIQICKDLDLEMVDIYINTYNLRNKTLEDLLELVEKIRINGKRIEGLVFRSKREITSKVLQNRLSFKVVNNDYLLKNNE